MRWTIRQLAVHDWIAIVYLSMLFAALAMVAAAPPLLLRAGALWLVVVVAIVTSRKLARPSAVRVWLYRAALLGSVLASYLLLADALPVLNAASLDAELQRLDERWFGFGPILASGPWITPQLTELMSLLYLGYFVVLALVVPPLVLVRRDYQQAELVLALLFIYCLGQTIYMVVPGYGPVVAFPSGETLPHGFWYDTMLTVVKHGGAQKDVFPSLHTAMPMVVAGWCYRHRERLGLTWLAVAVLGVAIVSAALFLGWHYLVDILAGLALAITAHSLAKPVIVWENERRGPSDTAVWPSVPPAQAPQLLEQRDQATR
jgi:membrane-associated phospholipid phosphatase